MIWTCRASFTSSYCLWNRESSPVGHLVCVGDFNYTRELEIRSRSTILLLPKSIAIACRVMLNANHNACRWCYVPHGGEMITKFYVFYLPGCFCILLCNIYKTHNQLLQQRQLLLRYKVFSTLGLRLCFNGIHSHCKRCLLCLASYLIK